MQLSITLGSEMTHNMVHLPIIRTLTRNLDAVYPEIMDEINFAFSEHIGKGREVDGTSLDSASTVSLIRRRMDGSGCQERILQDNHSN